MQVPVYNFEGQIVRQIEISDQVFAAPLNEGVLHQAMVMQQANARQGTASTKTRGDVAGSGIKLYRQKGTGHARAGDRRSPTRHGGGVAFGPHPRSYHQAMPKKMRQLALRSALSVKVGDGELKVLEELKFEEPKTKRMTQFLSAFGGDLPALIITSEPEDNVVKSARNVPGVKVMTANLLNVIDILSYKMLLITEAAIRKAEQLWGQGPASKESDASL